MNKAEIKDIIKAWILRINDSETLPQSIIALNFGLNESPYKIELTGAISYDEDDSDWACEEDFEPTQRSCDHLKIDENENWEIVLEIIVIILREMVAELAITPILAVNHITVGFCDGDLVVVK